MDNYHYILNMSNTTLSQYWWKTSGFDYTNEDTGMAVFSLEANWYLHALPGTIAGLIALIFVIITYQGLVAYKKNIKNEEMLKLP